MPHSRTDAHREQRAAAPDRESETLVYLVRHGETIWNRDRVFQGQEDPPLSDLGRMQAEATAVRMAGLGLSAVCTSDLSRARDTADAIARAAGIERVEPTEALREAHFGAWQGKTIEEVYAAYPREAALWRADSVAYRAPGGETLEEVSERSVAFLRRILEEGPGQRIAVVGHGASIKSILCHTLGAPLSAFRHMRLDNCSISTIRHTAHDNNLVLVVMNETWHLADLHIPDPAHSDSP